MTVNLTLSTLWDRNPSHTILAEIRFQIVLMLVLEAHQFYVHIRVRHENRDFGSNHKFLLILGNAEFGRILTSTCFLKRIIRWYSPFLGEPTLVSIITRRLYEISRNSFLYHAHKYISDMENFLLTGN